MATEKMLHELKQTRFISSANQKKADALAKTLEKYKDGKTPGEIQQLRIENRFSRIVRSEMEKSVLSAHPKMQEIINELAESEKKNAGMIEWMKYADAQHKLSRKFEKERVSEDSDLGR